MQETEFDVFTATPAHLDALIELGRHHYPAGHAVLDPRFLTWFYLENPAGPATLVVAREGALWIGLIVLIPVPLQVGGQQRKACFAVNVLTHPEHRGKSLFVKMIRAAQGALEAEGRWLLGHPNTNALPGWKRQKMQFRSPLNLHLARFALPFSGIRTRSLHTLEDLQALPPAVWQGAAGASLQRSPEWLHWRFLAPPHRKYDVRAIMQRDRVLGLRVTRRFKPGVDLMVDWASTAADEGRVIGSVLRPTLVMHPGTAHAGWRLPVKRELPFFASTWEDSGTRIDVAAITLAASDF
jgi:hypothetical protein